MERVTSTGSTNADLLEAARSGGADGLVLVTDHQTQGRGRQGRAWIDDAGGRGRPQAAMFSALVRPRGAAADPDHLGLIPLAAGVAVVTALAPLGADVGLKWPNDVLASRPDGAEAKLAGILVEATDTPSGLAAVVGIGINLTPPPEVPAGRPVALSELVADPPDRDGIVRSVLDALDGALRTLEGDPAGFLVTYRSWCRSLGREVTVETPSGVRSGRVVDIDDQGRLVLDGVDGRVALSAGDAHHRPVPPGDA